MKSNLIRYICVSGYFDPLHIGHLEYFRKAKSLGTHLVVIVNNDQQAILKKNKYFMSCKERIEIIKALHMVDHVFESIDSDRSVCNTLIMLHTSLTSNGEEGLYAFANGGDQFNDCIPEEEICKNLGIHVIDGLGDKIQSSSQLTGLYKKE